MTNELMAKSKMAFWGCESDDTNGLTWKEIEACEVKFAEELTALNQHVPSQADFNSADTNGNGILSFEEWEKYVNNM